MVHIILNDDHFLSCLVIVFVCLVSVALLMELNLHGRVCNESCPQNWIILSLIDHVSIILDSSILEFIQS